MRDLSEAAHAEQPAVSMETGGQLHGDAAAAGEFGDEEAAEQRVLGDLRGAPGWAEVMDMASRKVAGTTGL